MRLEYFHPSVEADMAQIMIDTWLYGNLARYGGTAAESSYANLQVNLAEGATIQDLLSLLKIPAQERGITFINGNLSAMPGMQPDLAHILHLLSMWPFQYRFGVAMIPEMSESMLADQDQGLHHTYKEDDSTP
jgi:hypothetical protein